MHEKEWQISRISSPFSPFSHFSSSLSRSQGSKNKREVERESGEVDEEGR